MAKKTDKTANVDPDVTVIGKESPYVTKSKPFKVKKASCKGKPFSLASIEIPGSVKTIREDGFANCTGLVSVVIQNGTTKIERNAFNGCLNLTSVKIPESMKLIAGGAFQKCPKLKDVVIPKGTKVEAKAF